MKTIEVTVYQYKELSEEAKKRARDWWRECEMVDPAWRDEHFQSLIHALNAFHESDKGNTLDDSEECKWTGYCADALLADFVKKYGWPEFEGQITDHYQLVWEKELEWRLEREQVEDAILANEYEFLESGKIY